MKAQPPIPAPRQPQVSAHTPEPDDTFSSTEALRLQFENTQKQAVALETEWRTFMESLLDHDETAPSSAEATPKKTEKSVALQLFGLLKALHQNRKNLISTVEQAQEKGLTQFQFALSDKQQPFTYEFRHLPEETMLNEHFAKALQEMECHPSDSAAFVKAVQHFVNDTRD